MPAQRAARTCTQDFASTSTNPPDGQNNLGACYEHALGCEQSYPRAVKWYRLAAARCLGTASMNLGYCHLRGHGVPADKQEALRLFRLAVQQGEEKARPEVERGETEGERLWQRFNVKSKAEQLWYYEGLADAFAARSEALGDAGLRRLARQLAVTVSAIRRHQPEP